jgi:hypothetical protein
LGILAAPIGALSLPKLRAIDLALAFACLDG